MTTQNNCPRCGRTLTKEILAHKKALRSKNTSEGLRRAKANGDPVGRPRKYDYTKIQTLIEDGMSIGRISKKLGCSKGSVEHVKRKLNDHSK